MIAQASSCRSCRSNQLETVLSLGEAPLSDALLASLAEAADERRYPLTLAFCSACSLVQLRETVSPEELYCRDYPYYSSFSETLLAHSRENAERLIAAERLNDRSLVVEIASNDGYLLRNFTARGIPVLGIDPAEGPAAAASAQGVPTLREFFGEALARRLAALGKLADVMVANNVLAHVPDLNGFVAGIKSLLAPQGVVSLEFPYVKDLIEGGEFDTIYHEHLCYFSLTAVVSLFARQGLTVHDVERLPIHGGSLRLHVSRQRPQSDRVRELLRQEQNEGVATVDYYRNFGDRVNALLDNLRALVRELRGSGKRIAAYGAAAKGSTLLNYAGLDQTQIEYVVDRNIHKHGRYMPGVHLPIYDVERLLVDRPDFVLLLAWNFREEIVRQQHSYLATGGRFIVPIPQPAVLSV